MTDEDKGVSDTSSMALRDTSLGHEEEATESSS